MTLSRPRKLLAIDWRSDEFPSLPDVARKVMELRSSDDISASELEEVIARDPGLAMKVLQVVNSGYYGLSREVTSVLHAITLLGITPVLDMAMSAIMARRFMTMPPPVIPYAKRLYRHCIATALLARDMDYDAEGPDLYTLGLLHDIGWLPVLAQVPDVFVSMFNDSSLERSELEGAWGTDHQLWGAKLAELWGLPEAFMLVAYRHHDPMRETAPPRHLLLVSIAHHLADSAGQSLFLSDVEIIPSEVTEAAGIDQETFFEMEKAAVEQKDSISALCNVLIG